MGKLLKLAFILLVINIAIFAVGDALHVNDFLLYLFLLPVSISVSLILFIIAVIKNIRNRYLAKDTLQRKASRKKGLIIFGCVVALLIVAYITFIFACGFKIPGRDRHKNWPYFPGSSNKEIILKADPDLYIYNIEPLKNTPYYLIHFTRDSIQFYNSNVGGMEYFGIIDNSGNFKVTYNKSTMQFTDGSRVIVKDEMYGDDAKLPQTCDVYDIKTLFRTEEQINNIPIPATKEEFDEAYGTEHGQTRFKEKYQTAFFKNLTGIRSIETKSDRYYGGGDYRGYTVYKDDNGKLYKTASYDDSSQLDLLSPQVAGYTLSKSDTPDKSKASNILPSGESIILYNDVNSGIGSGYNLFYEYHQTWLLYYTAFIGRNSTSFKLEGSDRDTPYTDFYQLNKVSKDNDTLIFVAENKLWRLFKKQVH